MLLNFLRLALSLAKKSASIFFLVITLLTSSASASELKDPRTRDEDISNSIVSVTINELPNDLYEYVYRIESNHNNNAKIINFSLDIFCADINPNQEISYPSDPAFKGNYSRDGKHVPVHAFQKYGVAVAPVISVDNKIIWFLQLKPGGVAEGHRVVSSYPPGLRAYELDTYIEASGWDYDTFPIERDDVPWESDFIVTGAVKGPSCKSEFFGGSNKTIVEPYDINQLLSYEQPMSNHIRVSREESAVPISIHYSPDIDPKSFRVKPTYLRKYFTPVPGSKETIVLNIEREKVENRPGHGLISLTVRKRNSMKVRDRDTDDFYIHFK
ncbi:MAG: hypothetical protein OEZ43_21365 [Gammaproteobacteria bacterium]|nr:hypothetical protein [Gammaproteobacteria bacterium]